MSSSFLTKKNKFPLIKLIKIKNKKLLKIFNKKKVTIDNQFII